MPTNCKYLNGTTSQAIKSAAGTFYGVVVNSHSSGTLKVWDNTAGSGTVLLNTITFAAGSGIVLSFPQGISFNTGLFFTVGGTIDYTALYF
jgi:hypothetical protein